MKKDIIARLDDIKGTVKINDTSYGGGNIQIARGGSVMINGNIVQECGDDVIDIEVIGSVGQITTGSGDVSVSGNSGPVRTGSGDVDIGGNVSGNVGTGSGDVDCGPVTGGIRTGSGDVTHK